MKNVYKQKREQGFTIIEVLIVLAIAALILLIVFLAVPALQRNSRNTSRKADVSNALASINEYVANNNGSLPSVAPTWAAPSITFNGGTTSTTKLGFFTGGIGGGAGQVTENLAPAFPVAALTNAAADDRMVIVNGGRCGAAGVVTQGTPRSIAVQYLLENGPGSYAPTCQES